MSKESNRDAMPYQSVDSSIDSYCFSNMFFISRFIESESFAESSDFFFAPLVCDEHFLCKVLDELLLLLEESLALCPLSCVGVPLLFPFAETVVKPIDATIQININIFFILILFFLQLHKDHFLMAKRT